MIYNIYNYPHLTLCEEPLLIENSVPAFLTIHIAILVKLPSSEGPKDNFAGCVNTRCSNSQHSTTLIQSAPRKSY